MTKKRIAASIIVILLFVSVVDVCEKREILEYIEELKARQRMKWFGPSPYDEMDWQVIPAGMCSYDPLAIEDVKKWEEEGIDFVLSKEVKEKDVRTVVIENIARKLAGLEVTLEEEGGRTRAVMRPAVAEYLEERLIESKLTEEQEILLYGGGDILTMDTERFVETVIDINDAYKSIYGNIEEGAPFGRDLNLQAIFTNR